MAPQPRSPEHCDRGTSGRWLPALGPLLLRHGRGGGLSYRGVNEGAGGDPAVADAGSHQGHRGLVRQRGRLEETVEVRGWRPPDVLSLQMAHVLTLSISIKGGTASGEWRIGPPGTLCLRDLWTAFLEGHLRGGRGHLAAGEGHAACSRGQGVMVGAHGQVGPASHGPAEGWPHPWAMLRLDTPKPLASVGISCP